MSAEPQEIEVKFYLKDLRKMEARLREFEARLVQARVHEKNIRFDTRDRDLRRENRVLRLRRDERVRLTYKGPSRNDAGVLSRTEIEVTVDDFEKARQFLEAFGFEKSFFYEKYRTTYEIDGLHLMLDETPLGSFIEIEGENADSIHALSEKLGLNWDAAVAASYAALFERVCTAQNLNMQDLSFENFKMRSVSARDLQVEAADE